MIKADNYLVLHVWPYMLSFTYRFFWLLVLRWSNADLSPRLITTENIWVKYKSQFLEDTWKEMKMEGLWKSTWPLGGCVLQFLSSSEDPELHHRGVGGEHSSGDPARVPRGTGERCPVIVTVRDPCFLSHLVLRAGFHHREAWCAQRELLRLRENPCVSGQSNQKKKPRSVWASGGIWREASWQRGPQILSEPTVIPARRSACLWGRPQRLWERSQAAGRQQRSPPEAGRAYSMKNFSITYPRVIWALRTGTLTTEELKDW